MPKPSRVLLVAGDPSGDEHGAALARALKQIYPQLEIIALGGSHLYAAADRFLYPLVGVGGFGFWEPLMKLPNLWNAWRQVQTALKENRPDVVIPIDYYGFNIHVARAAWKNKIPAVYYISPQVWASRPERINELAKVLNKMLVIFPFEVDLYRKAGIPVRFVGHPLLERIPSPAQPSGTLSIGLLPGSRWKTVERHLPILVRMAQDLRTTFPQAEFLLFRPAELGPERYQPHLAGAPWIRLVHETDYAQRKQLSLAVSVSGTAALENTLLGIPMIVMYKLSSLTYTIARMLIKVPYVAIPNILAKKAVVPELLQHEATPEKLAAAARHLLENPEAAQRMRSELLSIRNQLGQTPSTHTAAAEIGEFLPS
jgi:lipid-A-disaccharide synthase